MKKVFEKVLVVVLFLVAVLALAFLRVFMQEYGLLGGLFVLGGFGLIILLVWYWYYDPSKKDEDEQKE